MSPCSSFKEISRLIRANEVEFFVYESPMNRYQPAPPRGYFGMRSHKRRIFIALDNGRYPHPDRVNEMVSTGLYQEDVTFNHEEATR